MATPCLMCDNVFDPALYQAGILSASAEAAGHEARYAVDWRRDRTWWTPTTSAVGHYLQVDLGVGNSAPVDALWLDRGGNAWDATVVVDGSADGVTFDVTVARVTPVAGTLGGNPLTGWAVTEEGSAYMLFGALAARRFWRVSFSTALSAAMQPVVTGLVLGSRTQLLSYSTTFDEDAAERTQRTEVSDMGWRATGPTWSWRRAEIGLSAIGASEYDAQIRQVRRWLFEMDQPCVLAMDYASRPERAWAYQFDGTSWAMPKSRVHRAGRIPLREVGASL